MVVPLLTQSASQMNQILSSPLSSHSFQLSNTIVPKFCQVFELVTILLILTCSTQVLLSLKSLIIVRLAFLQPQSLASIVLFWNILSCTEGFIIDTKELVKVIALQIILFYEFSPFTTVLYLSPIVSPIASPFIIQGVQGSYYLVLQVLVNISECFDAPKAQSMMSLLSWFRQNQVIGCLLAAAFLQYFWEIVEAIQSQIGYSSKVLLGLNSLEVQL